MKFSHGFASDVHYYRPDAILKEDPMPDTGHSETTIQEHEHDCYCGGWKCRDETCEPIRPGSLNYGWRDCPFCAEDEDDY
jgi:hypothetical protein